jgi:DNA-binding transcriptional LysR family regulator
MQHRHPRLALRSQMRIQQLHMLLRLIESGTVRGAAVELSLSQSAVTKSLKELESLFGVKLFERTARGLRPTVYCAPLEEFARATLLGLDNTLESLRSLSTGREGRVAIGVNAGKPERWLGAGLDALRDVFPRLVLYQDLDRSQALMERLDAGEIDFALLALARHTDRTHYAFLPLAADRLVVVAPISHALAARAHVDTPALRDAGWVLPTANDPAREALAFALLAQGCDQPGTLIEASSDEAALRLATQHGLLALVPREVLLHSPERERLRELQTTLALPTLRYGVVRFRRRELRPGASGVLMLLLRRMREQRGQAEVEQNAPSPLPLVGSR